MEFLNPTTIMSFCLGIGLAASAGFRVFIPLFALSIAAYFGNSFLTLNENWQWIGSAPAMITLGAATLIEILAYYIPFIDNFLDTISVPLAAVSGTLLMAATLTDMNQVAVWSLAVIAGGGVATAVSGTTAATRSVSTGTTGGNWKFYGQHRRNGSLLGTEHHLHHLGTDCICTGTHYPFPDLESLEKGEKLFFDLKKTAFKNHPKGFSSPGLLKTSHKLNLCFTV